MVSEPRATSAHRLEPAQPSLLKERIRLYALAALTVILLILSVMLAVPFLPAITWGVALAILAWPVHRWIAHRSPSRGIAAALSTTAVATTILATGIFITYQIAVETASVTEKMDVGSTDGAIRDTVNSIPVLGRAVAWLERVGLDVQATVRAFLESNLQGSAGVAQGTMMAVVQFLLAMFILYYLFRDRDAFLGVMRDLLPLSRSESELLAARAADSVHATLYATVITSVIDSVAFGMAFWVTGLPAPVLWATVMFILSLLPVLGAGLVWVPATVYLSMQGSWPSAALLIAVGVVTAVYVDNVLYARLAGDRMRMHNVPVLIAFLGGLAVFGMSGMVLGPAILAVTEATLEVWRRRLTDGTGRETIA